MYVGGGGACVCRRRGKCIGEGANVCRRRGMCM